jgi:hypothetical protein
MKQQRAVGISPSVTFSTIKAADAEERRSKQPNARAGDAASLPTA